MAELVTAVSTRTYGYGRPVPLKDGRKGIVISRYKRGSGGWYYTLRIKE